MEKAHETVFSITAQRVATLQAYALEARRSADRLYRVAEVTANSSQAEYLASHADAYTRKAAAYECEVYELTHRSVWLCFDCSIGAANGDVSGLSDERAAVVSAGLERLGHLAALCFVEAGVDRDTEKRCECCRERSFGDFYEFSAKC